MSANIFKHGRLLPPSPPPNARDRARHAQELVGFREERERTDEYLRTWGYPPFRRDDRRNRPLRTKRATVSFIARQREADIVRLRCTRGLTFREIGKSLGISHVAAWKRFEWAMDTFRQASEYRAKCLREIDERLQRGKAMEATLMHLPPHQREEILTEQGYLPKPPIHRRRNRNHDG
jgi:DNA-directed RNA polymerase specialized sigma24 family protein